MLAESMGKRAGNHRSARFGHKLGRIWGVDLGNTFHDHQRVVVQLRMMLRKSNHRWHTHFGDFMWAHFLVAIVPMTDGDGVCFAWNMEEDSRMHH